MDSLMLLAAIVGGLYLGSCWLFPYRGCPWCSGRTKTTDGRGNFRHRRPCWVCGGQPYRRFGARLLGRGR